MLDATHYKKRFGEGATIVPRSFWFVQVKPSPLGIDTALPPLVTDPRAAKEAKKPYQDVHMQAQVESEFLYATLLSTDLIPFGQLTYRPVVLPLEKAGEHYRIIEAKEARERGFLHLASWIETVERERRLLRTTKADNDTALQRLDYQKDLTGQSAQAKYRVIYPMSATYMCAAVVQNDAIEISAGGQTITAAGFVADYKLFFYETNDRREAHYLAAILNSPVVDRLLEPMQTRGLFGPRDICKKVLELPIVAFKADDPAHQQLANLAERCAAQIAQWVQANTELANSHNTPGRIGKLRSMIRKILASELQEIDALVRPMLE